MDKEQVIALAREAGMYVHTEVQKELLAFAALVAAAQKEECAKLCAASQLIDYPTIFERIAIRKCAAAIRARGQA